MIELMLQAERALSMGLVDSAEHLYWQAVESDGRNVIAIVGLAKVALARGDDRTALQFARKALELDPEDGAARRLVERLEDLARLRTGSVPEASAGEAGATPAADASTGPAGAGDGAEEPAAKPSPPPKPSKADIEWPSTDVLGAAPSALPRPAIPPRPIPPAPTGTTGSMPPEPAWPATLPPSTRDATPPAATPPPAAPVPAETEKKRGLMDRFRRNG